MAEGEAQVVADTERWFLKRGIPHFIEGYDAGSDVFTRTLPALGFVFLVEVLGAANLEWAWWKNLLAIVGGLAVLVGAFVAVNKLRHRPAFRRPDDVGAARIRPSCVSTPVRGSPKTTSTPVSASIPVSRSSATCGSGPGTANRPVS